MKFRTLTIEELTSLKDEFVKFLVVNGIEATQWQKMKSEDIIQSQQIINAFSDFIFERIIAKANYIDFFDGKSLKLFHCEPDQIHLINIECEGYYPDLEDFLTRIDKNDSEIYMQSALKVYHPDRSIEIFRMIQNGGIISDGRWFRFFKNK
jgi:hypothetical protein